MLDRATLLAPCRNRVEALSLSQLRCCSIEADLEQKDWVMKNHILRIDGEVQTPCVFDFADMSALPDQIADVAALMPGRHGTAVRLQTLLETAGVNPQATHLTLHATDGDYAASVPLAAVADSAILVYRVDEHPLPSSQGGPVRFLIPNAEACGLGEVDGCANVKYLDRIEITHGPGKDTRPSRR